MLTNTAHSTSPLAANPLEAHTTGPQTAVTSEGCPTPLDWQQVVASYRVEGEHQRVETRTGPIDLVRFGSGPPLLLLNGFLGNHELFALLAWLLRDEHETIVIDWPVAGRRERGQPHRRLVQLANQLIDVADELGHQQWAVHASSFGCLVALQAMLDHPDRIVRASLQGAFAQRRFSAVERGLMWAARYSGRRLGDYRTARLIQQQNQRSWFPPFDVTRWDFYSQHIGRTPLRDLAERASLAGGVDLTERMAEINKPLLFISCEGDGRLSTTAQRTLAQRIPHSRVESLDNCGSIPHITHPHRLAKLLRQFRDGGSC